MSHCELKFQLKLESAVSIKSCTGAEMKSVLISTPRHPQLAPFWERSSKRIPEVYQPSFRSKIQNVEHQKNKIRFMKFENLVSVRATGADKSAAGPPDLGFWRPGSRKSY